VVYQFFLGVDLRSHLDTHGFTDALFSIGPLRVFLSVGGQLADPEAEIFL
jgi:hypothetical protein